MIWRPKPSRLQYFWQWLGYVVWFHGLCTVGIWRMGPRGYLQHRRSFEASIQEWCRQQDGGRLERWPDEEPSEDRRGAALGDGS